MLIEIMVGLVAARVVETPLDFRPAVFGAVRRGAFVIASSRGAFTNSPEIDDFTHAGISMRSDGVVADCLIHLR
jgi:hypothetical protein